MENFQVMCEPAILRKTVHSKNSFFLDGQTRTQRLVLKTTTLSLTDFTAVLSWPKNWTIENVSTRCFFKFMPLLLQLFGENTSLSGLAGI
jgi:hypothetical protein